VKQVRWELALLVRWWMLLGLLGWAAASAASVASASA
jgi:hypothetical protein